MLKVPAEYDSGALIVAAAIAVPFPNNNPVTLVESVNAGVAPPLDVPAKPLLDEMEIDVTYVPAGCLLLNVFQSVLLRYPLVLVVACVMPMVGVVPPVEVIGALTPIDVTGAVPFEAAVIWPCALTVKDALV